MKATFEILPPVLNRSKLMAFWELTKPRITLVIALTALAGFFLGSGGRLEAGLLLRTLVGTAFTASGASALNMVLEREWDAKMRRTRNRPLPAGRLQFYEALIFGIVLATAGTVYLTLATNWLAGAIAALTVVVYVFIYTPLKRRTSLCTIVGAVPGALPMAGGWVAARGALEVEAWLLFIIVFFWQLPHFLALAWMYREDYARGGFPMLATLDPLGESTGRLIALNTLALLPVSLAPSIMGLAGSFYFFGALALGLVFLGLSLYFNSARTNGVARRFYLASVIYLPVLITLLLADRQF